VPYEAGTNPSGVSVQTARNIAVRRPAEPAWSEHTRDSLIPTAQVVRYLAPPLEWRTVVRRH
jgi:hypothetical protein